MAAAEYCLGACSQGCLQAGSLGPWGREGHGLSLANPPRQKPPSALPTRFPSVWPGPRPILSSNH